jgi:hypothetical protein
MAPSRVSNADSEGSSSADVSMAEVDAAPTRPLPWNSKFGSRVSQFQPIHQPAASVQAQNYTLTSATRSSLTDMI